jgi:hypothetical protein
MRHVRRYPAQPSRRQDLAVAAGLDQDHTLHGNVHLAFRMVMEFACRDLPSCAGGDVDGHVVSQAFIAVVVAHVLARLRYQLSFFS